MRGETCFRIGFVQIRSPLLVCIVWFLVLYFDASGFALIGLLTSLWHELGHVLCYCILHRKIPQLSVSIGGIGLLISREWVSNKHRALLAFAGPAMNLVSAAILTCAMEYHFTVKTAAYWSANLLIALFNLLPVPPLDGFQILCCVREFWANKLHFHTK